MKLFIPQLDLPEDPWGAGLIFKSIRDAMHPFVPSSITVWVNDSSVHERYLHVSVSNLPSFDQKIDISNFNVAVYPDESFHTIAELVYQSYRDIPHIDPEPNIVLGDQ